ncbi:hypothetical protein [Streptomyces werraensis]|uniref:hypothetical protein n=1 Tax=Streptomyces werraensis TaxID=68284 RepID=UPI0036F9E66D
MAVGVVPDGLVNLTVVVSWTPTETEYGISILNESGVMVGDYGAATREPFGYSPGFMDLDMSLYIGLKGRSPRSARLVQSLAGLGYFEWLYPAAMSSKDRAKYEAAAL